MKKDVVRKMVITSILITIEILFQIIGNFISIGVVSLNLTLLPITIGAIMVGPFAGFILGVVNGILVLFAPSTISLFMPLNALGTVILCLLKTSFGGLCAGIIANRFKNKNETIVYLSSSAIVPIVNTSLFCLACFLIYKPFLVNNMGTYGNELSYLLFGVLGWNFVFEFASNVLLTPSICSIIKKVRS